MEEVIPIGSGLLLGVLLGGFEASWRLPQVAGVTIALGVFAVVVTGEAALSWGFLSIDIPLVGISAVLGLVAGRRIRALAAQGCT